MRSVLLMLGLLLGAAAPGGEMATVKAGTYRPTYPPSPTETEIAVPGFRLDRTPVTNAEFLAFVEAHPEWQRGAAKRTFVDPGYLTHWASPTALGPDAPADAPVTRVSWFAAKAYCAAQGARLPTEAEWEYAASASETSADGRDDPAFNQRILDWYSRPNPKRMPAVGQGAANVWGVEDLHGLVWEWVVDFNASLVSTDSRSDDDPDKLQFCGTGSVGANDTRDYAAFMRIAFRSSLKANYTTANLGFRCAMDLE